MLWRPTGTLPLVRVKKKIPHLHKPSTELFCFFNLLLAVDDNLNQFSNALAQKVFPEGIFLFLCHSCMFSHKGRKIFQFSLPNMNFFLYNLSRNDFSNYLYNEE